MDHAETKTKVMRRHALRLPFWVTLTAAILVVAAFFLPLATAKAEYADALKKLAAMSSKYTDPFHVMGIELSAEDAIHISMYELAKISWAAFDTIDKTFAALGIAIISATGILSLVTLLFTLFKKPVAVMIFNALTLGVYYMMVRNLKDLVVTPDSNYDLGIAYYLYYIGIAAVFAGAVWLLTGKIKLKRQKKTEAAAIKEENLQ